MSVGYRHTSIELMELPPELPEGVPDIFDDCSLAFQLGFRTRTLWYILHHIGEQYTMHTVRKRSGGVRLIHEPNPRMKLLLKRMLIKVVEPLQSQLGPHVTAYRKNRSIPDAVQRHVPACPVCDESPLDITPAAHNCPRNGLMLHIDLKDFFPTNSRAWVRNYFKSVGFGHDVSSYLASLATVPTIPNRKYRRKKGAAQTQPEFYTGVPQGSPVSGAICNLVADQRLDQPMLALLETLNTQYGLVAPEEKFVYSRYSDDLTITCGKPFTRDDRKAILRAVSSCIKRSGYRINPKKTRMSFGPYRKILLGTVFNRHPNLPKEKYYKIRAIVHNCKVHGFDSQFQRAGKSSSGELIYWLRGKINWLCQLNPNRGAKLKHKFDAACQEQEIEL